MAPPSNDYALVALSAVDFDALLRDVVPSFGRDVQLAGSNLLHFRRLG